MAVHIILGMAVQRAVAHLILNAHAGADLQVAPLEPSPFLADAVYQLLVEQQHWRSGLMVDRQVAPSG